MSCRKYFWLRRHQREDLIRNWNTMELACRDYSSAGFQTTGQAERADRWRALAENGRIDVASLLESDETPEDILEQPRTR